VLDRAILFRLQEFAHTKQWTAFGFSAMNGWGFLRNLMFNQLNQKLGLPPPHIQAFLRFAAQHSPYYREQDWAKNLLAGVPIRLSDIPVLTKSELRDHVELMRPVQFPATEGVAHEKFTVGTTGVPLRLYKSDRHFLVNRLENQRLLEPWHLEKHYKQVLYTRPSSDHAPGEIKIRSGENGRTSYSIAAASAEQLGKLLVDTQAPLLAALPSLVLALLDLNLEFGFLQLIKTGMESFPDSFGESVAALPNCKHVDLYGASETGIISLSCPVCNKQHIAHRNVFVEFLKRDGEAAEEGELARVVVTVFSNLATPLIRYDIGDIAVFSRISSCEPGRITIERIYGRALTLMRLPNGELILPTMPAAAIDDLGIKRFKLVQTAADTVEFRYQGNDPGLMLSQVAVQNLVSRELSPQFRAVPVAVTEFPLAPSGKYLMHERLID
jgi:phenylacetate-CoA ligase